jgi:Tol biopolymer transport system component
MTIVSTALKQIFFVVLIMSVGSCGGTQKPAKVDDLSKNSLTLHSPLFGLESADIDNKSRSIRQAIPVAAYPFSFHLYENQKPATDLSCDHQYNYVNILSNRIHIDFSILTKRFSHDEFLNQKLSLNCKTSEGGLVLNFVFDQIDMFLGSSSIKETASGAASTLSFQNGGTVSGSVVISADGQFAFWSENGRALSPNSLVSYRSIESNELKVLTNSSGALPDKSTFSPSVSSDNRHVVFRSDATNLISGVSGLQIYHQNRETGSLALVSSTDGTAAEQGNQNSWNPQISSDGRYVVFQTSSTNLVAGGVTGTQVYRKDLQEGDIVLVSSTDGTAAERGNQNSSNPQISSDGRYVVFETSSTNLVAGGVTGFQIYRKDLQEGDIVLVSSTDGTAAERGNQNSWNPQISSDGRYVVFQTSSTNLVAGGVTGTQVYRKDLQEGDIVLVSSTDGTAAERGNQNSSNPQISSDGRYVVFQTHSTNLVAGGVTGTQVYRKDLQEGDIVLVSSKNEGSGVLPLGSTGSFDLSSSGRFVVFCASSFSVDKEIPSGQIYRKDLQTGETLYIGSSGGSSVMFGNGSSNRPKFSPDGNTLFFVSEARNFEMGTTGRQLFYKNLQNGKTFLASSSNGRADEMANEFSTQVVSVSNEHVVFSSSATNLVSGSTGTQVFVKNYIDGTVGLVSSTDGTAAERGNQNSLSPRISSDGRYVVFQTSSTNLVAGGVTGTQVYRKDLQEGDIVLVSSTDGTAAERGNQNSSNPQISSDGRYVVFETSSTNLVAGGVTGFQIYRKDLLEGDIVLVSSTDGTAAERGNQNSWNPQISSDGRYVVFQTSSTNLAAGGVTGTQVYRKDLQEGDIVLVSSTDGTAAERGNQNSSNPQISSDGRYVVFQTNSTNLVAGGVTGTQVYRKDLQEGDIVLVSSTDGTAAERGNQNSSNPQISSDGRFVAFETNSTNFLKVGLGHQVFVKRLD